MHPVLFEAFGYAVPTYGLLVLLSALVIAGLFVAREAAAGGIGGGPAAELFLVAASVGLLGAKLPLLVAGGDGHGLLRSGGYFDAGMLAGTAAALLWLRARGLPILATADRAALALLPGAAIGRLGCLAAGCCHGRPCALPWAIVYRDPRAQALAGVPLGLPLHPAPLYFALAHLAILGVLMILIRTSVGAGRVLGAYLVLAGAARLALGRFRSDPGEGGAAFVIALLAVMAGLGLWWRTGRRA